MTYYKSKRPVDGKPPIWVIVNENGKIINKNPSKDELKGLEIEKIYVRNIVPKIRHYNLTDTCDRCQIGKLSPGKAHWEYDKYENETGKWICDECYRKFDPNSFNNIHKSIRDCRTNNLNPNCSTAKGDLFQELTCRWRSIVSIIPVEDINKKNDNYNSPIDHSRDSELGIIQTKGRSYNSERRRYDFTSLDKDWEKKFDNYIFYCISDDGKVIERIYIIPLFEIKYKRTIVSIYKNPKRIRQGDLWYEKYRITDEEVLKKANEIWKEIIRENDILRRR